MLHGRLAHMRKWEKETPKTPEYPSSSSCVIKGRGRQWDVYCAHKIFPSGNKSLWRIAADRPTPAGAPPAPARIQGIEMPFYSFLCINKLRQIFGWVDAGLPVVMCTNGMANQLIASKFGHFIEGKFTHPLQASPCAMKAAAREPSSSFAPLAAKMKCYFRIQETHKEVYAVL